MPSTPEYSAVRDVLEKYVEASRTGDVDALKTLFHPEAAMSGFIDDTLDIGTPEPFYVDLTENPSPLETGEAYLAEIASIQIAEPIASAVLLEDDLLGRSYVNHFHLLRIGNAWRIISKIYTTVD
jgi:hypothetical protein